MKRGFKKKKYFCGCLILVGLMLTACGTAGEPEQSVESNTNTWDDLKIEQSMERGTATVGEFKSEEEFTGTEEEPTITTETDLMDYDKQLQLIADSSNIWMNDVNQSMDRYFYAVTDLNQNGQLEIIQSVCMGTGFFTYSKFWEVNESNTNLEACQYPISGEQSEPDIINNPMVVYFDAENSCCYYLFHDDIRIGAAESSQSIIALSLQDGMVDTKILGESYTTYEVSGDSETTYRSADGTEIGEEEYNSVAEQTFEGMTEVQATIGWKAADEFTADQSEFMTEEETMNLLKASWEEFTFL